MGGTDHDMGEESVSMEIHPEYDSIGKTSSIERKIDVDVKLKGIKEGRDPIDLIIALDTSTSMRNSMKLCVETIEFMAQHLSEKSRLCVIGFGGHVVELMPWRVMNQRGKAELSRRLKKIHHIDGTNLYKGLTSAIFRLSNLPKRNAVSSIFFLTDGKCNEGVNDSRTMARYVKKLMRSVLRDTSLYVFGYGKSHDARLLSELTNAVRGSSYRYLRYANEIPLALCEAMGNITSVSGRNIKIVASVPDHHVRIAAVFTKRKCEISASRRIVKIDMGNLHEGQERDVLIRLVIDHHSTTALSKEEEEEEEEEDALCTRKKLLNVSVLYKKKDERRCITNSCTITEMETEDDSSSSSLNPKVATEMSRWIVASALQSVLDINRHPCRPRSRRPGVSEILVSAVEELKRISLKAGGMRIESHVATLLRFQHKLSPSEIKRLSSITHNTFHQCRRRRRGALSAASSRLILKWRKRL